MPKHKTAPSYAKAAKLAPAERVCYLEKGEVNEAGRKFFDRLLRIADHLETHRRGNFYIGLPFTHEPPTKAEKLESEKMRKAEIARLEAEADSARRQLAAAVLDGDAAFLRSVAEAVEHFHALSGKREFLTLYGVPVAISSHRAAEPVAAEIARWHTQQRAAGLPCYVSDFLDHLAATPSTPAAYRNMKADRLKSVRVALKRTGKAIGCAFDAEPPGYYSKLGG